MEDNTTTDLKSLDTVTYKKYTKERLMTLLDKKKLDALKKEFEAYPDGLEYQRFIRHMKKAIDSDPQDKYDLIYGLCKLFGDIDTNGDRKMQWSEFTQYVIDAVMKNPIKKNDKGELPTQKELLKEVHLKTFLRFNKSTCTDRLPHEGNIQKVKYCPLIDQLLITETKTPSIKFVTPDMHLKAQVDINSIGDEGLYFVMAAHYDDIEEILGCACSNKTIQFFSGKGNEMHKMKTVNTKGVQYGIWYLRRHKAWITVSKSSESIPKKQSSNTKEIIEMLKKNNIKEKLLKFSSVVDDEAYGNNYINDWSYNPVGSLFSIFCSLEAHQGRIMDVIELKSPPLAVTCSLDQTIKLWDLFLGRQVGILKPNHSSGVRSLDYTPEYSGTVISVAHENYIKVWSVEVSIEQAYVGILKGHNNAVVSAKFIRKLPYVISVDEGTTVRIWDIRSLVCLQVISNEKKKFNCNGLCTIDEQRFLIYGRKMVLFDTKSNQGEGSLVKLMREAYPIKVDFNVYNKTFMVATK